MPNIENNTMSTFTLGGKTFEVKDTSARSDIQTINTVLDTKADTSDMSNYYTKSETYNKTEVDDLIESSSGGSSEDNSGLTNEIKDALLACFAEVVWTTQNGQTLYNQLEEALGYYTITKNLGNATSIDTKTKIIKNGTYTDTFSPKLNYEITDITCTMGGISQSIINNNDGTYTINISEVIGNIIITITTSENISGVLHFIDFTQSLVDQITGDTVDLNYNNLYTSTPPTRDSNGLTFTDVAQWVNIAQVSVPCTIELKTGAYNVPSGIAQNSRVIVMASAYDYDGINYLSARDSGPLIFRASSGVNNWSAYQSSWGSRYSNCSGRESIANSTLKLYIDSDGITHLTKNDIDCGSAGTPNFASLPYLQLGSAANAERNNTIGLTIESIKIYDGEV